MRSRRLNFLVALFALGLVGFQGRLNVAIGNGTDHLLRLSVARDKAKVEPGHWGQVKYPDPMGKEHGDLVISFKACTLRYRMPATLDDYPWRQRIRGVVRLQFDDDLSLYAVPPNAESITASAGIADAQKGAFPVRPYKKECTQ
jgi:hypothetical protein